MKWIGSLLFLLLFFYPIERTRVVKPELTEYPAVVTYYEPLDGGINCDDDCTTMATGSIEEWMYGQYMACHVDLLGAYVTFDGIGTFRCMDTGGMIDLRWSEHHNAMVLYFDVLLHETPEWNFWLLPPDNWHVDWRS